MRELNENILKTIKKETTETKRLLVDKGSRLKPVDFDNIALAYTENKMTYIIEFDNNTSTVNTSLDELFNLFDKNIFYRASRQVIIAVKAIDKIEKYGNTQLKVITKPDSPIDIIISKAKITEFKKWAGKN
jgi:DNA-binding LytR/AlgR family response regulator